MSNGLKDLVMDIEDIKKLKLLEHGHAMGRVVIPHKKGCSAVALVKTGAWSTPWYITDVYRWLDKRATPHGETHRFIVAKCNSIDCSAESVISEDYILQLLDKFGKKY